MPSNTPTLQPFVYTTFTLFMAAVLLAAANQVFPSDPTYGLLGPLLVDVHDLPLSLRTPAVRSLTLVYSFTL